MSTPDFGVREIRLFRPRLRRDLSFSLQHFRDRDCYTVEDPVRGKFFRIGIPEYRLLQYFDGKRTVAETLAESARRESEHALTEHEAIVVVRWAFDSHLLETEGSGHSERAAAGPAPTAGIAQRAGRLLFLKIPLFNPDRLLERALPWCNWLLGWPFFLVWLALVLVGASRIATSWDAFVDESATVFSTGQWLWLGAIWVALKAIHELWHGLVCKRLGGEVPETGLIFILLVTPVGYVDATSSWRFPSKWQRIHVAAAGMYVELLLAAIAAIVWTETAPGAANTVAHQTVLLASVTTLLFNANPLLRFDGYYILSDLFEVPNLYAKGRAFVSWLGRRWLLGIRDAQPPAALDEHPWLVGAYGIAAAIWRVVVWVGILVAACLLLKGAGVLLVAGVAVASLVSGCVKFTRYLFRGSLTEKPDPVYFAKRAAVVVAAVALLLAFGVVPGKVRAPGVVEFAPRETVRAECSGFVGEVLVQPGQRVEKGDLLVKLENREERARLRQVEIERDLAELRGRIYYGEGNLPGYQVELENMRAAERKAAESRRFVESLEVRAPIAGTVLGRGLEWLPGTFVDTGDEILSVADTAHAEVRVAVDQRDADEFRRREAEGGEVGVRLPGRAGSWAGKITRVEPQASRYVPHPALSAVWGGPLDVRGRAPEGGDEAGAERETETAGELVEPHFIAIAEIVAGPEAAFADGEIAQVKFPVGRRRTLGPYIYDAIERFVRTRLAAGN